ncbi:MAG: hypothetical protein M3303_07045 [Gemmatimonadota bacterium]|nr:hypothetical protein [Gemmatimonadota bacterium]
MRLLSRLAVAAALVSFEPSGAIAAQQTARVAVGERVRAVIAVGRQPRHTGTVLAVRGDTLVLDRRGSGPIALSLASVARLERSLGAGRCSGFGGRGRCLLAGGLAGVVVGGAIGFFGTQDGGDMAGIGVILGAPVGLIVGLLVGSIVGGERWERVR